MNVEPKKDYLYKHNKYVNGDLVLTKSFVLKKRIMKFLVNFIVVFIFLMVTFIGYKALNPTVTVDGKSYSLQKDITNLSINDNVIYSKKNDYLEELLISSGFYETYKYSVTTLPAGISPETGKQLGKDKYVLRCESNICSGKLIEVDKSNILGKIGD